MRKNSMKKYVVNIVFGILFLLLAVFVLYIKLRTPEEERSLLKIAGQDVTKEEYRMVLNQYQARVKSRYTTEQVNAENFWTSEIDGRSPLKEIMELTAADLAHKKTVAAMAASEGLGGSLDFADIVKNWERENETRSDQNTAGEVVYGLSSYSKESYYEYIYYELEARLVESLKKRYVPTQEELEAEYDKRRSEYEYAVGVDMLIAETKAENAADIQMVSEQMAAGAGMKEMEEAYPEIAFYELTMNSLDTQEGKTGVYGTRWLVASAMQEGEICEPCGAGENILVMKCLSRRDNGVLTLEEVEGVLKSQIQTEKAKQAIEKEVSEAAAEKNDKALKKAALEILR